MELKNVFYACVIPFLIFFAGFAWLIYPNRGFIHPHGMVDFLAASLPANFAAPLSIVRNWSFAVFYVMAEMWGSTVASLLFWGLANEVTTVEEAKKYCMFHTFSYRIDEVLAFPQLTHSSLLSIGKILYLGSEPMLLSFFLDNMSNSCQKCEQVLPLV
jgi:ATP/ADP translocase